MGCSSGGSGGGSKSQGSSSAGSSTNATQWQTAMAALAQGGPQDPVRLTATGLSAFNDLIARNWPHALPFIRDAVEQEIMKAIPPQHAGGLSVLQVKSITFDGATPPELQATAPAPIQTLEAHIPQFGGAGWSLSMEVVLGGTIPINLGGGVQTGITVQFAATATASGVRVVQPIDMDLSHHTQVQITSAGTPLLQLQLQFTSLDPILSQVLPQVTQLLDPIVRVGLIAGAIYARQQITGFLASGLPSGQSWGKGGPALAPPTGTIDLEQAAEDALTRQLSDHMPFGNLYPAAADTPNSGGNIIGWRHHGDSALWTGVWLGTAAYRQDATGKKDVLPKIREVVRYYDIMTRVTAPKIGLLARTAMPTSSPHAAVLTQKSVGWVQTVDGVPYAAVGTTSRDSYTGTFFGLGQAFHRIPEVRQDVTPIVDRLLENLENDGWMVYQAPLQNNVIASGGPPGISVTFAQAPMQVANLANIGAMVNPARWAQLRARTEGLTEMMWFNSWVSSHEVHISYYGFSLANLHSMSGFELETDPFNYRGYLKTHRILRETVAHHQNAAFDAANGIGIPTEAATMAPLVQAELELLSQRPHRGFANTLINDPTIQKTTYSTSIPNQPGAPQQPIQTGTRSWVVSVYPIPIEKRPSTAYVWSSSPFDIDSFGTDPKEQHPGVDLTYPYWIARSHGLLK
jgi:hypothetical protein